MKVKKLINLFLEVDLVLRIIFILSFCFIFTYHIFLVHKPPVFLYAYELGKIFVTLSTSLVGAFIFYFINVVIPEFKKKKRAWLFISYKLSKITVLIIRVNDLVYKNAGIDMDKQFSQSLTDIQMGLCCEKIDPQSSVIMAVEHGSLHFSNWFELFSFLHNEVKVIKNDIDIQNMYFDTDLSELLSNLDREMDIYLNRFKGKPVNTDGGLAYFNDGLPAYYRLVRTEKHYHHIELRVQSMESYFCRFKTDSGIG